MAGDDEAPLGPGGPDRPNWGPPPWASPPYSPVRGTWQVTPIENRAVAFIGLVIGCLLIAGAVGASTHTSKSHKGAAGAAVAPPGPIAERSR